MKCLNCGKEPGYNGTENWTETAIGEWICPQCLEIYLDPAARKAFKAGEKTKDKTKAFRGQPTEKRVSSTLAQCQRETGAVLFKLPVEVRFVGKERIYPARSMSDFVGFSEQGEFIGIEAKSTEDKSLPPSAIRPNQTIFLDAVDATDTGRAYILADFREAGRWFLIDWAWWTENKGARLSNPDLDQWELDPLRFWAFLGGVSPAWNLTKAKTW